MSSESASSSLQATLDAYLSDAMGVRFDALSRFAAPLFDLYGVDPAAGCNPHSDVHTPGALHALVAALDTARLFWAYFSLADEGQQHYASAFKHCLIGTAPDPDAETSFHELVALMREQWAALPASMRAHAGRAASSSLPPFERLLEQHTAPTASPAPADGQTGRPQPLDQPEALALFAQPLLDDPAVHTDPDVLEERMALATAYWNLAHAPPETRPQQLETLLNRFADTPDDRKRLQQEARTMMTRFETLFPDPSS